MTSRLQTLGSTLLQPSAQWQQILLVVALAWLLFEIWRGWKLGLIRGVIRLMNLFIAWFAGATIAAMTNAFLLLFVQRPSPLLPAIMAALVGLGIYCIIGFLSALLFKKTEHHHGLFRWILGLGGAVCGCLFGLFFLWGGISLVRSAGLLGEMRLLKAEKQGLPASSDRLGCNLVKLKRSLEMGELGAWLTQLDPLSASFYETTQESLALLKDHDALLRFINAPSTQKIVTLPSVVRVLQDSAVQQAMSSGNILPLFEDKNIQSLFQDPRFLSELKSFDLLGTLNYALKKTSPQQK